MELATAAAELARTAQSIPRQVPVRGEVVGFTSWRAAGLMLGVVLVLVAGTVWAVSSRRGVQAELATAQTRNAQLEHWFTFFTEHRQALAQERPELAYKYFPYPNDPKPNKPKKAR
jgi:hypothetical protein